MYIQIQSNTHYNYLDFFKSGLVAFPECFKSSPEDIEELSFFPTPTPVQGFTLGYVIDGQLLGIVTFTTVTEKRKLAHTGDITRMYIVEGFQGKSIGYQLMQKVLEQITGDYPHILQVRLNVATHNTRAKRLYHKLGFEHYSTEPKAIFHAGRFWDNDGMILDLANFKHHIV